MEHSRALPGISPFHRSGRGKDSKEILWGLVGSVAKQSASLLLSGFSEAALVGLSSGMGQTMLQQNPLNLGGLKQSKSVSGS